MKKCEDIRELISQYIDGDMNSDLLSEFEEHILSCEDCRKELHDVKNVIAMLNNTPEEDLPLNFKDELHEKLLEEKAKKQSAITLILVRYSHVFASAAGFLIIFTIWLVYNNNISIKNDLPNTTSVQSYDSKEYGSNENMQFNYNHNPKESVNSETPQYNDGLHKISGAAGYSQSTQDQSSIVAMDVIPTSALNKSQPVEKYDSPEVKQTEDKNITTRFSENITGKAELKAKTDTNSKKEITDKSTESTVIGTVFSENLYKSADFTLNTKDAKSGRDSIRSIAASLGGEEFRVSLITGSVEATQKSVSAIPNGMIAESENADLLNFRIPANNYNTFLQKVNDTLGASNVITNTVVNNDYESRKKEIEAEVFEIDKKIVSNANNSSWNGSSEYNTLINNKNNLNRELDEIKWNSQYVFVTFKIKKIY
ncbi:zf-HC2 domain-containing protein [Pseudobacteroides cellulosolvens]|uniref:Anti-sigma-W factor RsiW n=1 Tax=Pseudobacteroides cellulosolvens ATCC 35603 = DSM 2933 TaxID=398512 RepID=A0A0L6JHP6_9FIRM|nr:zf-HC2 domain-containing protein [Pseudobacteroides cellulosolvens]KNY25220.1 putative transmembrane anti-sigma factor [Pseudobacteroides cellulosolvens ATCC 35603 = DSM 2933]